MSTRAVIVALLIALALGAVALYVSTGKKPAAPGVIPEGARILDFDPATVRAIRITRDGDVQLVERTGADSGWRLVIGPDNPAAPDWPLETERVTNLLRFLVSTRARAEPDPGATLAPVTTQVQIEHTGGAWEKLELSGRTLGGVGLVNITLSDQPGKPPLRALTDDGLHRAMMDPGPRAWRQVALFPGIGPEVSRIHLENQDRSMTLARIDGKWRLREPVGAPTDPAEIHKLFSTLSELRISDFYDERPPDPALTSLEKPLARLGVETDTRILSTDPGKAEDVGAISTRTSSQQVLIGSPSDSQALHRYAHIGTPGRTVSIIAAGITQALFDPARYISRRTTDTLPADIGGIIIEPIESAAGAPAPPAGSRFTRVLDHWTQESPAGEQNVLPTEGLRAVADLLRFLTTIEAATVSLAPPPSYTQVGRLTLLSLGGAPLGDELRIGAAEGNSLVIHTVERPGSPGVYRGFPSAQTPPLLAALASSGRAAVEAKVPPKPPEQPGGDEVFK